MAKIYVDNNEHEVDSDKNLLEVCLTEGYDLPYFCWHPAMGSVGACRQCAVKRYQDEDDEEGELIMACMEPASDGTLISIEDEEASEFRSSVIEWLMTNHPHDCPTCDEGGECHLQDMTVMAGHTYRRHRFNKRTFRNQDLGPFVNHEMNRCIQCYRCVRFYRDYAGGDDLEAFASRNRTYFGRHESGPLENEFSGNLVEICPTGVFTDKSLKKHYTRKWDFTNAPSICHQCGLGCNILPGERYGDLRRIRSRYNGKVNGYFLCDRGRYGYEHVNSEKRIRHPLVKRNGKLEEVNTDTALDEVGKLLKDNDNVIGIGSARASLEANFTLRKMVGEDKFYHGVPKHNYQLVKKIMNILKEGPARTPSMKETEEADAILVLGEDLTNTAPMLALSLRQAVNQKQDEVAEEKGVPAWHAEARKTAAAGAKNPLFVATPQPTKLDGIAEETIRKSPQDIARIGYAVASAIDGKSPNAKNLSKEEKQLVKAIADTLQKAENPLIVSGVSMKSEAVVGAAANVAWALCENDKQAELSYTVPECNSMGMAMMEGQSLDEAFETIEKGDADTAVILENNLYRHAEKKKVDQFLEKCENLILLDFIENEMTGKADAIVSVGAFAETDGTLINNEGRAQRYYQVFVPEGEIQESWRWLRDMTEAAGRKDIMKFQNLDNFIDALVQDLPVFKGIEEITPRADFRIKGLKIPRQTHRYSGRTANEVGESVHEPQPPDDPDSPMSFTMEGYRGRPPSSNISFYWSPGWNSVQSLNKYQIEVGGGLHGGDPGKRLIEPPEKAKVDYFDNVPKKFRSKKNQVYLVPLHHIFGSDELSMETPGVEERAPSDPWLVLNEEEAESLKVEDGDEVDLDVHEETYKMKIKLSDQVPKGVGACSVGLPDIPNLEIPDWGTIKN